MADEPDLSRRSTGSATCLFTSTGGKAPDANTFAFSTMFACFSAGERRRASSNVEYLVPFQAQEYPERAASKSVEVKVAVRHRGRAVKRIIAARADEKIVSRQAIPRTGSLVHNRTGGPFFTDVLWKIRHPDGLLCSLNVSTATLYITFRKT